MNEQTSSRVSAIAARLMSFDLDAMDELIARENEDGVISNFCADVRTLAASALTQDETPGQADDRPAFLVRLEAERAELHERVTKLAKFLGDGCPGVASDDEKSLLLRQHSYMANYLALLNQRGTMHGLDPVTIPELTLGESDGA